VECDIIKPESLSHFEDRLNLQLKPSLSTQSTAYIESNIYDKPSKDMLRNNIRTNRYDALIYRYKDIKLPRDITVDRLVFEMKNQDSSNQNKDSINELINVQTELSYYLGLLKNPIKLKKDFIEIMKNTMNYECLKMNILIKERYNSYNFNIASFLRSDLPPSFLREIGNGLNWELIAINFFMQEAQDLKRQIELINIPRRDFDNMVRTYKNKTNKIKKLADNVLITREQLDIYTDIWNCKNLNEFRRIKDLKFDRLEKNYFQNLIENLQNSTKVLSQNLISNNKKTIDNLKIISEEDNFLNDFIKSELLEIEEII
jgi:hypothetical protein